jgi:hypothetical protein
MDESTLLKCNVSGYVAESMSRYNFLRYCILSLCYSVLLFYCAVHCYLFFCVLLVVMYVYLSVYIVL